jgi:hypothetical protein
LDIGNSQVQATGGNVNNIGQSASLQLMLAEVAKNGLTAVESRRQQLAIGRFRCVAFADAPNIIQAP